VLKRALDAHLDFRCLHVDYAVRFISIMSHKQCF